MAQPRKRPSDKDDLLRIVRTKEANRLLLRARPNVVGLDVGFRKRQGKETEERVVKVYVSRKIDASFLPEEQRIPSTLRFDGRDVGVDVEQRAIPRPQNFTLRDRPLRGGMSISTTDDDLGGTGTLGICVTLNDGNTYILSNNHVLAGANTAPIGTPILQPSEGDGGVFPADLVATLTSFVPLDFGFHTVQFPPLPPVQLPNANFVDAALARIIDVAFTAPARIADSYNVGNRELHWIGYPRPLVSGRWTAEQKLGLLGARVCKMGRTSEFTRGSIISLFSDLFVGPYVNGLNAWFEDQIQITGDGAQPFSKGGDSGSLVVAFETGEPQAVPFPAVVRGTDPIGLVFSGGGGPLTWANPLDAVLDELVIPQL